MEPRYLQTANNTETEISIAPDTVSGVLITLFIFGMMIIAISCLYSLQTPQGFTKVPLVVGKEQGWEDLYSIFKIHIFIILLQGKIDIWINNK